MRGALMVQNAVTFSYGVTTPCHGTVVKIVVPERSSATTLNVPTACSEMIVAWHMSAM
jgi:hypothetical protein